MDLKAVHSCSIFEFESSRSRSEVNAGTSPFIPLGRPWKIDHSALGLNEKVGFKRPTTCYRKNSILCGALHIGSAKWTSGVRWSFWSSRVARGIKGS